MTVRLLPHSAVSDEHVIWGAWWRLHHSGERQPIGDRLAAWDYAQDLRLVSDVTVDVAAAVRDAELDESAEVAIAAMWDCASSFGRGVALQAISCQQGDQWSGELLLDLPAGQVAKEVTLERHLILAEPPTTGGPLAAKAPGARLGPVSRTKLILEGEGGRFPIEPVPFSALLRESAAWALEISYEDLGDSFLGAVRLLLNTEHPATGALLSGDSEGLLSVLRYDLVRALLVKLADDSSGIDEFGGWEDDSIGGVLEDLCQGHLDMDLRTTLLRMRAEPLEVESLLQARLGFLRGFGDDL
jgi:hypothetical protein